MQLVDRHDLHVGWHAVDPREQLNGVCSIVDLPDDFKLPSYDPVLIPRVPKQTNEATGIRRRPRYTHSAVSHALRALSVVTVTACRDQVGLVVTPALGVRDYVVAMKRHLRRSPAAVNAGEVVPPEDVKSDALRYLFTLSFLRHLEGRLLKQSPQPIPEPLHGRFDQHALHELVVELKIGHTVRRDVLADGVNRTVERL